jgi:hypothetical protein
MCYRWQDKSQLWTSLLPLGIFTVIAYPIGIIVIFTGLLNAARKNLNSPAVQEMLLPLFEGYKYDKFFW